MLRLLACLLLPAFCGLAYADVTPQIEVYTTKHFQIEIEEGSPAWDKISAEEKERYLKETEDGPAGKRIEVQDLLAIKRLPGNQAAFCVAHVGHLIHMCDLEGQGEIKNGVLSFQHPNDKGCKLTINLASDPITVEDNDNGCKSYCGFRASFGDGIEFQKKHKVTGDAKFAEELTGCKL